MAWCCFMSGPALGDVPKAPDAPGSAAGPDAGFVLCLDGLAQRFCVAAFATAAATGSSLELRWLVDDGRLNVEVSGPLEAIVPEVDRDVVRSLGRQALDGSGVSATGPSGIRYDVIDFPDAAGVTSLLWIWRRLAGERRGNVPEALVERLGHFLGELREVGVGSEGESDRAGLGHLGGLDGAAALSLRERTIVGAVLAGRRTGTIARELEVSDSTVRSHLSAAFRKLGVRSQVDLIERFHAVDRQSGALVAGIGAQES